jgi:DNA ligase-4
MILHQPTPPKPSSLNEWKALLTIYFTVNMPFPFRLLCDLLNELDQNRANMSMKTIQRLNMRTVVTWFNEHGQIIPRKGPEAVAFLSCLFPERRPDRVFNLQEKRLETIIRQAQCLGASRLKDLQRWRAMDGSDSASCVERVMAATDSELRPGPSMTLEELDEILDRIAATSSFSSVDLRERVKAKYMEPIRSNDALSRIFRILNSCEAKWMVRMALKTYSPVQVPETLVLQQFHVLLPDVLRFQNSFEAAVKLLQDATVRQKPTQVEKEAEGLFSESAVYELVPQIGIMITRPPYEKARSIKHCSQLAGQRRLSVERKYDGEYCQVHIDLSKGRDCIKIFSKSGKDSTYDRIGLHRALQDSLRLGRDDCQIKRQCILEGELMVWSDRHERIEPFYKIRKHVQRSGRFLGTIRDSPVDQDERLMIIFYDLLLLDGTVYIRETHNIRHRRLCTLVDCITGRADITSLEIIDFSSPNAPEVLGKVFAQAIVQRWEGLVLKGCDDPYISLNSAKAFIKLKKDYIPGLGDTADFAIVGGHRDAKDEQELGIGKLWWTSFYIGCLENKEEVCRFNTRPRFRIIDRIERHGISKGDILHLNQRGYFERVPFAISVTEFDVKSDQRRQLQPAELFKHPFVVELVGAGFDKPANARYFTLRFPRVLKIHQDRTFKETVSFNELQELARQSMEVPGDSESEEEIYWIGKLQKADSKSGCLVQKSITSSSSGVSSPTTVTGMTGIDIHEEKGKTSSFHSSKRKMTSEISSRVDSAAKRAKQGEMGKMAVR